MDNRQYRDIVDAFADMVYRIALNQTRCAADADDVVQAVFLKLYTRPPAWLDGEEVPESAGASAGRCEAPTGGVAGDLRGRSAPSEADERLKAWLIRVTANECRSLWRSLWRRRVELREVRDEEVAPYEEPAFSDPAYGALYAALAKLPEKCRIVVHLFYFEGYGTREIGAILGVKEPTVRTRLVRARKLLKQQLKEAWDDEQPEPLQSHDGRGPCLC